MHTKILTKSMKNGWRSMRPNMNQWPLLSEVAASSASAYGVVRKFPCTDTHGRQAATPCGVQLVKAICNTAAARILLQDRYLRMLQNDARYVLQEWARIQHLDQAVNKYAKSSAS